ncbi:putative Ig domain-containing protein [Pedobacter nutrimenti]|uniref:putative Ig domain-containing protein n=1 Tax=Pedobacter nutrimenti TaxID=1241337 RepID=UPI00292D5A6E|nr:putative Ig domain-containing protein [Pedobacter nutrimenti]
MKKNYFLLFLSFTSNVLLAQQVPETTILNTHYEFKKNTAGNLTTQVELTTKKINESISGALQIVILDPEFNRAVKSATINAHFENDKPFLYTVHFPKLDQTKSYLLKYRFTEVKSGEKITTALNTPYILTPPVKNTPRINSPDIYAARSGNDFFYKIPATGRRPLSYQAKGLPQGLSLNTTTGIIEGKVAQKGDYEIELVAVNTAGTAKKKLVLKIGDEIGLTPALGWNSWNAWGLSVSDEKVRISAREMADKLMDHGWSYVNIDDGWEAPQRAAEGEILTNKKFPDMKSLSDYVHGLGLKIGIYSSPGDRTCGGYLGSLGHELQDAQTYAKWKIDYLKYDWCSYDNIAGRTPSLDTMKKPYYEMRHALDKTGRDILYSLCQYGMGDVYKWGKEVGGNSWRTTNDITDTWASMSHIGFGQAKCYTNSQAGGFIDPDMLIVGKVGWGPRLHNTRLTPDEQYTHISLWSLLSSPLLIGCDMGQLDDFTLGLLTNDEVIAIDQDAKGKQARQALVTAEYQVWVKDLQDGSKAVGVFNLTENYKNIEVKWKDVHISGYKTVRDIWIQKKVSGFGEGISAKIPPHGVKFMKVTS